MIYFIASLIIIVINAIPAFMPSTWMVVSFIYIRYKVSPLLLAVLAAVSSSIGRFFLARLSKKSAKHILSKESLDNLDFITEKINGKNFKISFFSFAWALSPFPSNPLFIAVGLSRTKIKYVLLGFFIGRVLSYFFLAYFSKIIVENLEKAFEQEVFDLRHLLINFFSIGVIFLYAGIDWKSLFQDKKLRFNWKVIRFKGKEGKRTKV